MKYRKPVITLRGDTMRLIQGGNKDLVFLLDFFFFASTGAYEADE